MASRTAAVMCRPSLSSLRGAMTARAANHGWDESLRDQWGMPACVVLLVQDGPGHHDKDDLLIGEHLDDHGLVE